MGDGLVRCALRHKVQNLDLSRRRSRDLLIRSYRERRNQDRVRLLRCARQLQAWNVGKQRGQAIGKRRIVDLDLRRCSALAGLPSSILQPLRDGQPDLDRVAATPHRKPGGLYQSNLWSVIARSIIEWRRRGERERFKRIAQTAASRL